MTRYVYTAYGPNGASVAIARAEADQVPTNVRSRTAIPGGVKITNSNGIVQYWLTVASLREHLPTIADMLGV